MPSSTSLTLNADMEKRLLRRQHEKQVSKRRLTKVAQTLRSAEDLSDLAKTLCSSATQTADNPVYDAPRLRVGTQQMALGAALIVAGLVAGYFVQGIVIADVIGLLMYVGTLVLLLCGAFFVMTGHDLRTSEHLPKNLSGKDIDQANTVLVETKEDQRSNGSSKAEHLSRALLTGDAAILLWLVAPDLLPNVTPTVHLVVVAVGALLIGKLANDSASAVAVALRKGRLLAFHDQKTRDASDEGKATVSALRRHYDVAVGGRWPIAPGFWAKYSGILPGLSLLLLLTGALLALRLFLGSTEGDLLTVMVVSLLIFGTTAVAIALKVRGECLVPHIARAKRIISRFPTREQFEREMAADRDSVRNGLTDARRILRHALEPRTHGAARSPFGIEDLTLDIAPSLVEPKPLVRIMSTGSVFAAPAVAAAHRAESSVAHKAASGFRPNPGVESR